MLGANHEAATVARTMEREAWLGYRIVGFVDDTMPVGHQVDENHEVIGTTADLRKLITEHDAGPYRMERLDLVQLRQTGGALGPALLVWFVAGVLSLLGAPDR